MAISFRRGPHAAQPTIEEFSELPHHALRIVRDNMGHANIDVTQIVFGSHRWSYFRSSENAASRLHSRGPIGSGLATGTTGSRLRLRRVAPHSRRHAACRLELTQSVALSSGRTTQVRRVFCTNLAREGSGIEPEGPDIRRQGVAYASSQINMMLTIVTVCTGLAVASTAPAAPKLFPARVALGQSVRRSTCLSVKG